MGHLDDHLARAHLRASQAGPPVRRRALVDGTVNLQPRQAAAAGVCARLPAELRVFILAKVRDVGRGPWV